MITVPTVVFVFVALVLLAGGSTDPWGPVVVPIALGLLAIVAGPILLVGVLLIRTFRDDNTPPRARR